MGLNCFGGQRGVLLALSLGAAGLALSTSAAVAQAEFKVAPVAEKKVTELPAGALYWQIENFPTRAEAEAAAGPLSLAAEADGKAWLFTLGPRAHRRTGDDGRSGGTPRGSHGVGIPVEYSGGGGACGGQDHGPHASGHGGVLRGGGSTELQNPGGRGGRRRGQDPGRGRAGHAHGGLEHRHRRPARTDHVRGRSRKPFSSPAVLE